MTNNRIELKSLHSFRLRIRALLPLGLNWGDVLLHMCLYLANIFAELTGGIVVEAALHENEK